MKYEIENEKDYEYALKICDELTQPEHNPLNGFKKYIFDVSANAIINYEKITFGNED